MPMKTSNCLVLAAAVAALLLPLHAADIPSNSPADGIALAPIPYVKTDGEIRALPRTRPDRQYQLYIGLPKSYTTDSTRIYPVIYVTDGYWSFSLLRAIYWNLRYDKTIPECILVGIGYVGDDLDYDTLRNDDLSAPLEWRNKWTDTLASGQADQFLQVVETLAIPMMEREYRADPSRRVLMGGSLGGHFTLYAAYTNPTLFHGYVAASPVIAPIWLYEEAFAQSGATIAAKVFLSIGALESNSFRNETVLFHEKLSKREYLKNGYAFRIVPELRHTGAITAAFVEGLQYVFEPLAPESGVAGELSPEFESGLFLINFLPSPDSTEEALWGDDRKEAMAEHRLRLETLVAEKRVLTTARSPDGSKHAFATVALIASDLAEAQRLAADDPAVRAGHLRYEVLLLSSPPGTN